MAAITSHLAMAPAATHATTKMGQWISSEEILEDDSEDTVELYEILSNNYVNCPELRFDYIPVDVLDKYITPKAVLDCTNGLDGSICPENNAREIVEKAKKTFAILVLSGCESIAYDLLIAERMTDADLPLSCNGRSVSGGPKTFLSFTDKEKLQLRNVKDFCAKQWHVLAPVFGDGIERVALHPKQPIPVRKWQSAADGYYSNVFRSELHPAHYKKNQGDDKKDNHGNENSETAEPRFLDVAIKELNSKADFEHEYSNLVKTRILPNPHLIKHMAAYEVESGSTPKGDSKHFIIFPWADGGDLGTFWKQHSTVPRTPQLILWSLEQMLGLATGIRDLHSGFEGPTHCRHGDLKPLNILRFVKNNINTTSATTKDDSSNNPKNNNPQQDLGTLVIGDLGISKIRDKVTSERNEVTGTKATTPDYEPPEALVIARRNSRGEIQSDNGSQTTQKGRPWSRKYDMWSLGCIFLEFTIWLFYNNDALEGLASRRKARSFYVTATEGGEDGRPPDPAALLQSARVCPAVKEAMNELREDTRCHGNGSAKETSPLVRLVDLIEQHLLITEANLRYDADTLVSELWAIVDMAKKDPVGHFGKISASAPPLPTVFTPLYSSLSD